jgi:hypothetical protein
MSNKGVVKRHKGERCPVAGCGHTKSCHHFSWVTQQECKLNCSRCMGAV